MKLLLVFKEKMAASHENMLAKMAFFHEKVDMRNAKLDAHHEKMIPSQERMITKMDVWLAELKDSR
jgi:nucleoside 2-deoxyribosyltransferase